MPRARIVVASLLAPALASACSSPDAPPLGGATLAPETTEGAGVVLQGGGTQDGSYDNGTIAAAYRPDFEVVYLDGTGNASFGPMGDWPLLVANACAVGFLQRPRAATARTLARTSCRRATRAR